MLTKFLGKDTTIGLYQTIYDITRVKVWDLSGGYYTEDIEPPENKSEQNEEDLELLGPQDIVSKLKKDSAQVYLRESDRKSLYDKIDVEILKKSQYSIKVKLIMTFAWTADAQEKEYVLDVLEEIIDNNPCKFDKKLTRKLQTIFSDSLVNDRFIVNIKKSHFTTRFQENNDDMIPVVVEHNLEISDDAPYQIGGKEYKKTKKIFEEKQSKK